jgi:K+-transporting ATPase KdpF subunit
LIIVMHRIRNTGDITIDNCYAQNKEYRRGSIMIFLSMIFFAIIIYLFYALLEPEKF